MDKLSHTIWRRIYTLDKFDCKPWKSIFTCGQTQPHHMEEDLYLWKNSTTQKDLHLWTNPTTQKNLHPWTSPTTQIYTHAQTQLQTMEEDLHPWTNPMTQKDLPPWTNSITPYGGGSTPTVGTGIPFCPLEGAGPKSLLMNPQRPSLI